MGVFMLQCRCYGLLHNDSRKEQSVESALGGLIKTVLNYTLRECSAWCFELNEEGAVSGAS